jgi:chemotaxis protein methyltransferase CheR
VREDTVVETGALPLGDEEFRDLRDLIARRSGIYIHAADKETLRTHIGTRMERCGTRSLADYLHFLISSSDNEFEELLNLVAIQETYFFRDQAQFMALQRYVIPELLRTRSGRDVPLRIWSAGCSTGEEPYTIALLLAESLSGVESPRPYILATDVSRTALDAARLGVYGDRSLRSTPEHYRQRFFVQEGESYILDESIKGMVEFRPFNLMNTPYPGTGGPGWDIIFCRNVTIYFRPESTRKVIRRFYESLGEGGYLFTGFSETLRYLSRDFLTVQLGGIFLYQKSRAARGWAVKPSRRPGRGRKTRSKTFPTAPPQKGAEEQGEPRLGASQDLQSRASELLESGLHEQAGRLLAPLLEQPAPPTEAVLLQAEILLNQGRAAEAKAVCEGVIRREPLTVAGHYLLAIIHRTTEEADLAVDMFRRVVYLRPEHALARFHLGELYARRNEREAARREYGHAIRLLRERSDSLDQRFAGGFSPGLLIETCRSRLEDLDGGAWSRDIRP